MLSVESILNEGLVRVKLIQNKVGVVLVRCRENNHFEDCCHLFEKSAAVGAHAELLEVGIKVDQSLVEVKHKSVGILRVYRW